MSNHKQSSFRVRWHRFWSEMNEPRRDPAALSFARLGLLATRW